MTGTPLLREATRDDVPAVAALLADDLLGRTREGADPDTYLAAFDATQAESHNHLRGQGIGALLIADAEARARAAGCALIQLTSNAARTDARRFCERLDFTGSHIGFKKPL